MRSERHALVLKRREEKKTFNEIGSELGISASRAREIYIQAQRWLKRETQWYDGLPVRIANPLLFAGYKNKEEVKAAIGRIIRSQFDGGGACIPNLGKKGIAELCNWLGIEDWRAPR